MNARLAPPKWLTALAWIYLLAFGFELLANLSQGTLSYNPLFLTVGLGRPGTDPEPLWWALVHIAAEVGLAIGCLAVLLRDRDLAGTTGFPWHHLDSTIGPSPSSDGA